MRKGGYQQSGPLSPKQDISRYDYKQMGEPVDGPATAQAAQNNRSDEDPITVAEITCIAKNNLPKQVWDYYASGADEEVAVERNKTAFDR